MSSSPESSAQQQVSKPKAGFTLKNWPETASHTPVARLTDHLLQIERMTFHKLFKSADWKKDFQIEDPKAVYKDFYSSGSRVFLVGHAVPKGPRMDAETMVRKRKQDCGFYLKILTDACKELKLSEEQIRALEAEAKLDVIDKDHKTFPAFEVEWQKRLPDRLEVMEFPHLKAADLTGSQIESEVRFHEKYFKSKGWQRWRGCSADSEVAAEEDAHEYFYIRAARLYIMKEWHKKANRDSDNGSYVDIVASKGVADLKQACRQLCLPKANRMKAEAQAKPGIIDKDDQHFKRFESEWAKDLP